MNKQQLASKIWESANKMRSKIEANEYKDYILGFIFYKFLSDKEIAFLKKKRMTDAELKEVGEQDRSTVRLCQNNIGYFIAYDNLFSTWIAKESRHTFEIANVSDALSAFKRLVSENHKKVFDGIFDTLDQGLRKLGDTSGAQTKAVAGLIKLIKDIPMDGRQDYDVLGFIYEYLISNFAANAGKKAGEFYTPHEVSVMMSEIIADHLKSRRKIDIYDPTSGSGSLLINIGRSVAKHIADRDKIKYYAQELKANTYNLTRMNLVMRGIIPENIVTRNGDTLEDDWPFFDESDPHGTYDPLYVDAVVSNPPYSQSWSPTEEKRSDPRFGYGLAPKSKADYAFLLHDLYHLKSDGIMTIVLPHGVLFRPDEEKVIRTNLVENNHISAIIGLPADIFFGTPIATIVMVLRKRRDDEGILFVDASRGCIKAGKKNRLRASDIRRIVDTVIARKDVEKYSRLVSREVIRANDYNLNIARYVDSSDDPETWDLYATMAGGIPNSELDLLQGYWTVFAGLRESLFSSDRTPYSKLAVEDVSAVCHAHRSVKRFATAYVNAFAGFEAELERRLIGNLSRLSVIKEERAIADAIFSRLEGVPLVDPYAAYQHLADRWQMIANDLEILQTEGFDAVRIVDPNMVPKKKDGKEEDVQDGWIGHVIPFELVQATLLKRDSDTIRKKETEQAAANEHLADLIGEMEEEEKEKYLNDENDAFDKDKCEEFLLALFAERFPESRIRARAAQIKCVIESGDIAEDTLEGRIVSTVKTLADIRSLKSEIKKRKAALHELTKATIEKLTDAEAKMLLKLKWITPLVENLARIPDEVVDGLSEKVEALQAKYAETFNDVERQMKSAKGALSGLLGELTATGFDAKGLQAVRAIVSGGSRR